MAQSYSSPLLTLPGAVPDEATGVALHYGNPLAEQRHMREHPALIDRSHRAVVRVGGPDAATFLNNLLSQKLDDVPAGFGGSALDLDMQGHVLHHVDVIFNGEAFYFDMPRAQHESFVDYLTRMKFWSDVTIEDTELAVVTVLGGGSIPGADMTRAVPFGAWLRIDGLVPRESLHHTATEFSREIGTVVGLMAFEAARVRALEPELGVDLDSKSIPHEVPRFIARGEAPLYPAAVHLNKGCYRGQETVARVENLGRSPRLLVMLQLDGSSPSEPQVGAAITAGPGGRTVGRLGTVVHDADEGPIALALVKRSALDGPLEIDGTAAVVDAASLPTDEGEHAGRRAVEGLRRGTGPGV